MKKLLLYLMTLLVFGAVPVDSFAAASSEQKALYIETPPSNWQVLHIWWWGSDWGPSSTYGYKDGDGGTIPDLLSTNTTANLGAVKVEGTDGKTYLKVMLPSNTTTVRLAQNEDAQFSPNWDNVYNYNNDGKKWTQGQAVSSVIPGGNTQTKNTIILLGSFNEWSHTELTADLAVGESHTFTKVKLGSGKDPKFKFIKKVGNDEKWLSNGNTSLALNTSYTIALSENGTEMKVNGWDTNKEYNIAVTNTSGGINFTITAPTVEKVDYYFEVPSSGDFKIWWWKAGGSGYAADRGYKHPGPNLANSNDLIGLGGVIFDAPNGKKYYKVPLERDADRIQFNGGDDINFGDNSYVWTTSGKSSTTVASIMTVDYSNITVKYRSVAYGSNWPSQTAGKLSADGKITITGLKIGNGEGFNLLFDGAPDDKKGFAINGSKNFSVDVNQALSCDYGSAESYIKLNNYNKNKDQNNTYTVTIDYAAKTILVAGQVTLGDGLYLKVPNTADSFNNGTTAPSVTFGNNKTATMSSLTLGSGEFLITVYNSEEHTNSWYTITMKNKSLRAGSTYAIKKINYTSSAAPSKTQFTGTNNPYMTVMDAEAGDKFDIFVDLENEEMKVIPDYSVIGYSYKINGNTYSNLNVPKSGRAEFTIKTGAKGGDGYAGFNFNFKKGNHEFVFPMSKETATGQSYVIPADQWEEGEWIGEFTGEDWVAKSGSNDYISGLEEYTDYSVFFDYGQQQITIIKIPTELYLIGGLPRSSWDATQDMYKLTFDPEDKTYKINLSVNSSTWFSINEGAAVTNNSRYTVANRDPLSTYNSFVDIIQNSNKDDNSLRLSQNGDYLVSVKWGDTKQVKFQKIPALEMSDFTGFQLIVHYNNGTSHTTPAKKQEDGKWITVDEGYEDRGMENVGSKFDGLGLGLQNFYLETINKTGLHRYWAITDPDGVYQVPVGTPITLTQFATAEDASKAMQMSGGNANSRYNVTWDWANQQMTVNLNDVWASYPNQMYLYCLNSDVNGNITTDDAWTDVTIDKILDILNDNPKNNKVFVLERSREGLYQNVFDSNNKKDLNKGVKFCIVGRTGQIYNIATEKGSSYELTDNWNDKNTWRMPLTTSAEQDPAIVKTEEVAVADFFARVRTPNTLDGKDKNDEYLISFETRIFPPVSFTLYSADLNDSANKTKVDDFVTDEAYFSLDDINLHKNKEYFLEATYEDGRKVWFGAERQRNVGVSPFESDIQQDSENGFVMSLSDFETSKANLSIIWNNGRPVFAIEPDGVQKTIKVFFVDRAGWGNVYCYAYSDIGVKPNPDGSWTDVQATNLLAKWPGVTMIPTSIQTLYNKVQMEDNNNPATIYELAFNVEEYANGSYNLPKVLFNNGNGGPTNQTYNLYLVDGGIYSNNSPSKDLKDENGNPVLDANDKQIKYSEYPATEYLPRMQYNYMDGPMDQDVLEYPNDFHETDYNTIYVDVPEFVQWYEDANNDHEIAISIKYDRDGDASNGKEYMALGVPGTHKVYVTTIGNKKFLKVDLAGYIIPDNTKVDLKIWPLKRGKDDKGNIVDRDNSDWNDANHSSHANCTKCTDSKGVTYNGNHFTCYATEQNNGAYDNYCPLIFTNVAYNNGNVYRRYLADKNTTQDPVVSILDITNPEALYIVPNSANFFNSAITSGHLEGPSNVGSFSGCYKLKVRDPYQPAKLVYLLPKLTKDAEFYIVADFGEGNAMAFGASNSNFIDQDNKKVQQVRPGNPYTYQPKQNTLLGINNQGYEQVKSFEGSISWTDSQVLFSANKNNAEIVFVDSKGNDATGKVLQLPAHRDNCELTDNHLTRISFQFAPGYDNYCGDLSRLGNLKVELRRDPDYERYFGSSVNKPAIIVANPANGNIVNLESQSVQGTANTDAKKGQAYIYVRGYTAGMTTLHIEQTQSDNNFARMGVDIPLRIVPTIEGIGLHVNHMEVKENGGQYSVVIGEGDHMDGSVNFKNRLQLQATTASDFITEEGAQSQVLHILWGEYEEGHEPEVQRQTIMRRATPFSSISTLISDVNEDKYANVADDEGLSEFSIYNAPKVDQTKNASKNVKLQIQQNGINSPLYNVYVTRNDDMLTGVDTILGGEEVEAVYYNLNGVRVDADRLEPGIYVKVQGNKSEKIYVR